MGADFQFDDTGDDRTLKLLNIVDEYTSPTNTQVPARPFGPNGQWNPAMGDRSSADILDSCTAFIMSHLDQLAAALANDGPTEHTSS